MNREIFSGLLAKSGLKHSEDKLPSLNSNIDDGNKSRVWYFSDESGQRWVIKQYPEWVAETDISWIHNYMFKLAQKGFPLAEAKGEPLSLNKNFYAVYSFADGTQYDPLNKSHFVDMAEKLGLLHNLSHNMKIDGCRNWPVVAGFTYRGDNRFLTDAWNISSKLLQNYNGVIMPIHGDFRKDNIRFSQSGISKVFDFGNARNDYPEVDLAISLRDVSSGLVTSDWVNTQSEFLKIYKNFVNGTPRILPDSICGSGLVLAVQENSYLLHELSAGRGDERVKNALADESNYLEFLLANLSTQLLLYRSIFT